MKNHPFLVSGFDNEVIKTEKAPCVFVLQQMQCHLHTYAEGTMG